MRSLTKKGQISLSDAPQVVMIVGFIFLIMATIAYVADEYGSSIVSQEAVTATCNNSDNGGTGNVYSGCSAAYNVTDDLQTELGDNTSIAGIVLTISLVGIVLSILIGIFVASRRRGF